MEAVTFLAGLLAFWSLFHLAQNQIIGSIRYGPAYSSFLFDNNIGISFCHVRWITKKFNKTFKKIVKNKTVSWKIWFNCGIVFAIIAMGMSTTLLCRTLYSSLNRILFKDSFYKDPNGQVLTVIVPGVNLPLKDVGYLVFAIFFSGILHECGHAIAAAREGIQVNGVGTFIFILYPGAFVDLNSTELSSSHPLCQLRIYCAGVWHNFVTCIFACILILLLPYLLLPFYFNSGNSAMVSYQSVSSPFHGASGLNVGDFVTSINDCNVKSVNDWFSCLNKTKKLPVRGTCLSTDIVEQLEYKSKNFDEKIAQRTWQDCCDDKSPSTHICFKYASTKNSSFTCLPGRKVVLNYPGCMDSTDCPSKIQKQSCYYPHLAPGISFVHITAKRLNVNNGMDNFDVVFVGSLSDVFGSITMTDYIPRTFFIPLRFPEYLLRFLQYMFSISGALALLNIVPSYALDGQWAFNVLFEYGLSHRISNKSKFYNAMLHTILFSGTALLAANIIVGFYTISFL